jgi:hypothetical protein
MAAREKRRDGKPFFSRVILKVHVCTSAIDHAPGIVQKMAANSS